MLRDAIILSGATSEETATGHQCTSYDYGMLKANIKSNSDMLLVKVEWYITYLHTGRNLFFNIAMVTMKVIIAKL